jgi:VanZ family protein
MTAWHWLRRQPLLYFWLPVAAWMGLIFYLSAQPDLPTPPSGLATRLISSAAHVFLFGVLAWLWARAMGGRRYGLAAAFALTLLFALSDEFHQAFVPGRNPDAWDLVCDMVGAALGLFAWSRLRRG